MAAAGPMTMVLVVAFAGVIGRAVGGIGRPDFQLVLLDTGLAHVVEMAVVQVIDVAIVPDGFVAAVRTVLVRVIFVMSAHPHSPFLAATGTSSSSEACARAF